MHPMTSLNLFLKSSIYKQQFLVFLRKKVIQLIMIYKFESLQDVTLILSVKIKSIDQFNEKIITNKEIVHASLNPKYLVSIKALMIALNKLQKSRDFNKYSSDLFQRDLHYLLIPQDVNVNKFLVQDLNIPIMHVILGNQQVNENIFENRKYLLEIKQYYQISDLESQLDQDIRGSIYNQIVLKKLRNN
ncbi:hypothetical protein pb186bvf_006750 [Paramecium bursaria]